MLFHISLIEGIAAVGENPIFHLGTLFIGQCRIGDAYGFQTIAFDDEKVRDRNVLPDFILSKEYFRDELSENLPEDVNDIISFFYPFLRDECYHHSFKSEKIECPPLLSVKDLISIQKIIELSPEFRKSLKHTESERRIRRKNRLNHRVSFRVFCIANDRCRPEIVLEILRRKTDILRNHLEITQESPYPLWAFEHIPVSRIVNDMGSAFSENRKIFGFQIARN